MKANLPFSSLVLEDFALPSGPTRQRSPEERLVLAVICDAVDSLSHASKHVRVDAAKWIEDRTEAPWSFTWACSIFGFDAEAFRWKLRDRIEAARGDDVPAYTRRTIVNNVGHFSRSRPHRILRDFHVNSAQASRKNISVRRERDRSKQVAPDRLARIVAAIPVEPARAHVRKVYSLLPDLSQSSIRVAIKVATQRGAIRRVAYGVYSRRSA